MKELFVQSVDFWKNYWGDSVFPYLLCAAVLYLLIFRRKNRHTKYILFYVLLTLAVFFCPLSAGLIQKCIGELVYWRVLWVVPAVPVMAFAMTEFLKDKKGILQFLGVVLCAAVIILCGKEFYSEGYYQVVHNYQQVPDEVAGICEMVKTDASGNDFKLAADNYIASYIRSYDASIKMPFGREGRGIKTKKSKAKPLYFEINSTAIDYGNLGKCGKKAKCDYLVAPVANEDQKAQMAEWGYEEIGTVGRYGVYRLNK